MPFTMLFACFLVVALMASLMITPPVKLEVFVLHILTLSYTVSKIAYCAFLVVFIFGVRNLFQSLRHPKHKIFFRAAMGYIDNFQASAAAELVVLAAGDVVSGAESQWRRFRAKPNSSIEIATRQTVADRWLGEHAGNLIFTCFRGFVSRFGFCCWIVSNVLGILMCFGLVRGHAIGICFTILGLPTVIVGLLMCNWPLMTLLFAEFEFWFLVSETTIASLGLAASFGFDDRTWNLILAWVSVLIVTANDACHRRQRRFTMIGTTMATVLFPFIMLAIALQSDVMDTAPSLALGNLDFPVSKMSFSSWFTVFIFFAKRLFKVACAPGGIELTFSQVCSRGATFSCVLPCSDDPPAR